MRGAIPTTRCRHATPPRERFAVLRAGSQSRWLVGAGDDLPLLAHPLQRRGACGAVQEQRFALELLLDPEVSVVALDGRRHGQTLLAIAAGLEQVVEKRRYERLAVYRPVGARWAADVGFLPGGLDEKLDPWIRPSTMPSSPSPTSAAAMTAKRLDRRAHQPRSGVARIGHVPAGPFTAPQIVVVDEAQHLEPTTLKTVLTRIGEGTKVIFTATQPDRCAYMGESNTPSPSSSVVRPASVLRSHHAASLSAARVASLAAELL